MTQTTLVFREAQSIEELRRLLSVRYMAYRDSRCGAVEPPNPAGFNLDAHDRRASHFGLFAETGSSASPIGYLRVVEERETRFAPWVTQIAGRANASGRPAAAFPFMSYWPDTEVVDRAYRGLRRQGARCVEASRLSLLPTFRSTSLARGLMQSAVAVYFGCDRADASFLATESAHARYYAAAGFQRIPGTTDENLAVADEPCCCLLARPEQVPERLMSVARTLARQFSRHGRIVLPTALPQQRRAA